MPKRRAATHRTKSRGATRQASRDLDIERLRGSLAAVRNKTPEAPPKPPPPPVSPLAENQVQWSVDLSRRTLHAALTLECEHAAPGSYCYGSTKGVCRPRYLRGRELVAAELRARA